MSDLRAIGVSTAMTIDLVNWDTGQSGAVLVLVDVHSGEEVHVEITENGLATLLALAEEDGQVSDLEADTAGEPYQPPQRAAQESVDRPQQAASSRKAVELPRQLGDQIPPGFTSAS